MPATNPTRAVLRYAIASRILLLTLIILWRSLLSPYDTSASLNPTCLSLSNHQFSSLRLLPPLKEASYGIPSTSCEFHNVGTSTNRHTPFCLFCPFSSPFYPTQIVFWPLIPVIGYRAVLGLSGYVINNVAFLFAAIYFYRLSVVILKDSAASLRASILFCFNPASIFYSSIYSESLYALFSIGGIYYLMSGSNIIPVILLALSGSARSNGVLNAGYYGFKALHESYYAMYVKKRADVLLAGALRCICIFIPFLAFQAYGYYNICHGHNPDEMRPWCKARVPLLYSFIQSHYWGVGFLHYFQLKQLPNFLLASPVLSLAFCSIFSYLKTKPGNFFSLGFGATLKERNYEAGLFFRGEEPVREDDYYAAKQEAINLRRRKTFTTQDSSVSPTDTQVSVKSGYYATMVLPFIYHLGFMAATAFFVMHVQVATRFLSASPPLYWYASYLMASVGRSRRWSYLIWAYAASYILLGSLLFSNFYPFT